MAFIRPCADLRNNYSEISKICHETNKPIYITKNGYNDLVILSNEAYEELAEKRVNELLERKFEQKYSDFETFKNEIYSKINKALEDVKHGRTRSLKQFCEEMEGNYINNEKI